MKASTRYLILGAVLGVIAWHLYGMYQTKDK